MINESKLEMPAIALSLAAVALVLAWKLEDLPEWLRAVLAAFGLVMTVIGGAALLEFFVNRIGAAGLRIYRQAKEISAITPEILVVREIAQLTSYQAEIYMKRWVTAKAIPGWAGATLVYDLGNGKEIPPEFVQEFFAASNEYFMQPVTNYHDGTKGREWAVALTEFFVQCGLAYPNHGKGGPYSARWISPEHYKNAMQRFDLIEEE